MTGKPWVVSFTEITAAGAVLLFQAHCPGCGWESGATPDPQLAKGRLLKHPPHHEEEGNE